jgi:hypothetical protein
MEQVVLKMKQHGGTVGYVTPCLLFVPSKAQSEVGISPDMAIRLGPVFQVQIGTVLARSLKQGQGIVSTA